MGVTGGTTQPRLRIALVDDHLLFLHALSEALAQDGEYAVVLTHDGSGDVVHEVSRANPEVLLLDVSLHDRSGLDLVEPLLAAVPGLAIVMLSGGEDSGRVAEAFGRGAVGYLTKGAPLADVRSALHRAARGETVLPRQRLSEVVRILTTDERHEKHLGSFLTERERDILARLAAGHATTHIGADLHITHHTVRTHIQNVLTKLGAHSKLEAAAIGVRAGIVTPHRDPPAPGSPQPVPR